MRRKWLDPRKSKVLKVAVGGTVLGLAGGATAFAGVRAASPEVDAPSDDSVSLDLEDGTVEVDVEDQIHDDLDGTDQGADASANTVSGDTPPAQESVETIDSVDQESVEADEESVDNQDQESVDQESVDNDAQDDQSVDNEDQSSNSD